MAQNNDNEQHHDKDKPTDSLSTRIKELGDKATQLLTFLSFALVAAILLQTSQVTLLGPCQKTAVKWAIRFWVLAFFPILMNVLPVKEFMWENPRWYRRVRFGKVILLWIAVVLIIVGVIAFLCAIW